MNRKQRRTAASQRNRRVELDASSLLNQAMVLHRAGRFAKAQKAYQEILKAWPDHFDSLHLLGVVYHQLGHHAEAIRQIDLALAVNGNVAAAHCNRAAALLPLKRFGEALESLDRSIALEPNYAEALNNRGNALQALKRLEEALASYDKALVLKPDYIEALLNRGSVLRELRCLDEAMRSYNQAITLKPALAEAWNSRGVLLRELKRLDEALTNYDKAIALKPDYAEAYNNRGNALRQLKRLDEALESYDKAIAIKSDYTEAFNNRGSVLWELRRLDEALTSYDRAIALKSDYAEALNHRGNVLQQLKRPEEALINYDKAIALKPDYADAWHNRGNVLGDLKRFDEAVQSYEKLLGIKPYHRYALSGLASCVMQVCDWRRREHLSGELCRHVVEGKSRISPFVLLAYSDDAALQLSCAKYFIRDEIGDSARAIRRHGIWRNDRIRVAYLSADFHRHATAYLMAGLFELHDRSRFEVIGISFGDDDGSDMRARLIAAFDQFIDVRKESDKEIAQLLTDLRIDIAVDLKGYTKDSRPGILAFHPAPIQVSYLGFPATMGADFIDYIIADAVVLPFNQQAFYTEKIVHLPSCYQVNDGKRLIASRTPTRVEVGLPAHSFVFCCFNNNWKITPAVFGAWMRLLKKVDGSVLWLLSSNSGAEANLRSEAAARGIDASRLIFANRLPLEDHLARHRLADLFLDTLPYNAHTTVSDALWAGLPVLTCQGRAFAGRVAASLLNAVGLPELVAHNLQEYEALATRLATDAAPRLDVKERLEQNRLTCPLFDTDQFRQHIEAAYASMWELWQRGQSPRSFSVDIHGGESRWLTEAALIRSTT